MNFMPRGTSVVLSGGSRAVSRRLKADWVRSGFDSRPLALDLFCGAGGASVGLHRAGFDVSNTERFGPSDDGKPLAIDLFAGLGGWTEGLLLEGFRVIGFDIERHQYGEHRYPAQLVVQDVLTLHGSQFKDATLIVASPPCQKYSYMAMPWSRAKAMAAAIRADVTGAELERLNRLFNACFRIQREACEAAGHHIPMVVENVKGAQPWVGRARWSFGSFYLWGDVPALMPITFRAQKVHNTTSGKGQNPDGRKGIPHRTAGHWTNPAEHEGRKNGNDWFGSGEDCSLQRHYTGTKRPGIKLREVGFNVSMAREVAADLKGAKYERSVEDRRQHIGINRKAASAMIAKIPLPLSRHIAATYHPQRNVDRVRRQSHESPSTPET